jgi:hypothetical protein
MIRWEKTLPVTQSNAPAGIFLDKTLREKHKDSAGANAGGGTTDLEVRSTFWST